MRYRKIENVEISEIGLDCPATTRLGIADVRVLLEKALSKGVTFVRAVEPEETAALGHALSDLGVRRRTVVAAGVSEFFSSHARHNMTLADFLEHELSGQLTRLKSDYIDCFLIDLGAGRSLRLEEVLREAIPAGDAAAGSASYEGGVFLHETIVECVDVMERFKREGRVRLVGISGENVAVLKRIITKNKGFDVVFAPYNYAFRTAADELIPIASETKTAVVAVRPLWWSMRAIPITVLAQSPCPRDLASLDMDDRVLTKMACKWPLSDKGVTSVMAEADSPELLELAGEASTDPHWTRSDEEMLSKVAAKVTVQDGLLVILSAMNSHDPDIRARGWAAYIKRGLPESGYDPFAGQEERALALAAIAKAVIHK